MAWLQLNCRRGLRLLPIPGGEPIQELRRQSDTRGTMGRKPWQAAVRGVGDATCCIAASLQTYTERFGSAARCLGIRLRLDRCRTGKWLGLGEAGHGTDLRALSLEASARPWVLGHGPTYARVKVSMSMSMVDCAHPTT